MGDREDFELLDDVSSKEVAIIAQKWAPRLGWPVEKAERNVYAWLFRIRVHVKREQKYLNTVYAKQRASARVRKFTTSGALPLPKDDEEEKY